MPKLLTLREAAEATGYSVKTLRNRIKSEELRAIKRPSKYGDTYFVPETEVARMLVVENAARPGDAPTPAHTHGKSFTEAAPAADNGLAAVLLKLTERVEEQAAELGRFKAITERSEVLEAKTEQLSTERDRLAAELAAATEQVTTLQEQLAQRHRRRWFGLRSTGSDLQA